MNLLSASDIFGNIPEPSPLAKLSGGTGFGIGNLLNILLKTMIVIAGIYTLINLVLAGYSFISAGDDVKKVQGAWAMIWQSLLGLAVAAGAFVLAGIFGKLIFGDWNAILSPAIPTL